MTLPDIAWNDLHFLRPLWLWALAALPAGLAWWWLRRRRAQAWREVVDAHLLPHLLVAGGRGSWLTPLALSLAWVVAVLAMAGPSWRQVEQPLFRSQMPLVIALDLSTSIMAGDLPPSRLLQARAKLATLLRERRGGDVALLAYAGDSFTVAPLTEDARNVALFLDALGPEVMPVDGKRADRAIEAALNLLAQAGYPRGDILLLSDSADGRARSLAAAAQRRGYRVSALGLGSAQGAAYRDSTGAIEQARLDEDALRALASAGGGGYARLQAGDADLKALGVLDPAAAQDAASSGTRSGRDWRDDGYWLLLPVMLLVLPVFRRRAAAMTWVGAMLLPALWMPPAHAQEGTLWRRADQVRQQRVESGVDAYRRGDFAAAGKAFDGDASADAQYNLGNALARQGDYDAAIAAYDRALAGQPGMPDAVANRAAVEAARKRRQQDQQQDPSQNQQQGGSGQPQQGQGQQSGQQSQQNQQNQQNQSRGGQPQDGGQQSGDRDTPPQGDAGPQAADQQAQQQADQAQQQRMQQALQQQQGAQDQADTQAVQESAQQREQRQAVDAWMRRVPDDPGSLLRSKFRLEHERRQREGR